MIDTNELRRKLGSDDLIDHNNDKLYLAPGAQTQGERK